MKNVLFAFAMAAVAVSCTSTSEEAAVETTVDTTVVENLDSLEAEAYEGDEAAAE